eukprot:CAMPEP_0173230346 /NCGR_PEP_ID=MMETSP1142-20121109/7711_1 /TAXON_ID=483371 /ORGANISM="non described non described, Strain CCMP2298" /LENGTH=102 /DNA_ID=CAMNT_0014159449 /DNA_START=58 /DNA_END=366 /DNA_ORIENTATION=-
MSGVAETTENAVPQMSKLSKTCTCACGENCKCGDNCQCPKIDAAASKQSKTCTCACGENCKCGDNCQCPKIEAAAEEIVLAGVDAAGPAGTGAPIAQDMVLE